MLEKAVIPDGVTALGSGDFSWCFALKEVVLPASITSVESYAFDRCEVLERVLYRGSESDKSSMTIGYYGNETFRVAAWTYNYDGD